MDADVPDTSGPDEQVARRWATVSLVAATAGLLASVLALTSGIGALLAIVAIVVALWVRLGLAPYGRPQATAALWIAAATLVLHLALYTVALFL